MLIDLVRTRTRRLFESRQQSGKQLGMIAAACSQTAKDESNVCDFGRQESI
jgi:hypothetical protein